MSTGFTTATEASLQEQGWDATWSALAKTFPQYCTGMNTITYNMSWTKSTELKVREPE